MMPIAEYRKAAKLTQAQLADKLGIGQAAVAHWENNRRTPSVKMLQKIAAALQIPVGKLLL